MKGSHGARVQVKYPHSGFLGPEAPKASKLLGSMGIFPLVILSTLYQWQVDTHSLKYYMKKKRKKKKNLFPSNAVIASNDHIAGNGSF